MEYPLEVTFHRTPHDDALEALVHQKWSTLQQRYPNIVAGHVTIDQPHAHKGQGNAWAIKIRIEVPGPDVIIDRSVDNDRATDPAVAIRDAFKAANRRLDTQLELRRGHVKAHEEHPRGEIVALFPDRDYGLIHSDGRDIYFHRNAVLDDAFDRLERGARVAFVSHEAVEGEHASMVRVL